MGIFACHNDLTFDAVVISIALDVIGFTIALPVHTLYKQAVCINISVTKTLVRL